MEKTSFGRQFQSGPRGRSHSGCHHHPQITPCPTGQPDPPALRRARPVLILGLALLHTTSSPLGAPPALWGILARLVAAKPSQAQPWRPLLGTRRPWTPSLSG